MLMTKVFATAACVGLVAALLLAARPVQAADAQVKISNFTFAPKELRVKAGTTVIWTNEDDIPHTIVSPPGIRSKPLDTDDKFSFTFTTPGSFTYFCGLHPHMTGSIVVEAATGSNAPQ